VNHLLGQPVRFVVTDPWEFQAENPEGHPEGTIAAIRGEALLIRLKGLIRFRGDEIKAVVATSRVPAEPWGVIDSQGVSVNLTPARATSEDPDQLFAAAGKWRAWHLIADMSLLT
jgi:hypothetical protein